MKKLSPNLFVSDVKASKEFYEKLGFKAESLVPDENNPVWASMVCENVEIMLQERVSGEKEYPLLSNKPLGATITLFVKTDHIDELYQITKDENLTIVNDMHKPFYCEKEFAISDPDGYVLTFAM